MKIWTGFDELVEILDLKSSEDPEAIDLVRNLIFISSGNAS